MIHLLQSQPFILIFAVVAVGMLVGRISVKGIGLGNVVGIILTGLLASIVAQQAAGVKLEIPALVQTIFFNTFIFAVGVRIGPQFFSGLERDGWRLVVIGLIVVVLAPLLSLLCGRLFHLPQGAVPGLLAGANNSSAAFGGANSAAQSGAIRVASGSSLSSVVGNLSAAFALGYTVAEIVFVLYMRLLPRMAGFDARAAGREFEAEMRRLHPAPLPGTAEAGEIEDTSVAVRAYRIDSASKVAGQTIESLRAAAPRVSIERVRRGNDWMPLAGSTTLEQGDELVAAARIAAHVRMRELVGPEIPDAVARGTLPVRTVDVVVAQPWIAGHTLDALKEVVGAGIYPNAVFRAGTELPLTPATELKRGDVVRLTGTESHIADLPDTVGPVVRASHLSDVLTLSIGLVIGALLGAIPVPLFGLKVSFGAAAVLITGIVFGWLKTRHPAFGGPLSEGGRSLLEGIGLNVFTAVLGINAGADFLRVITGGSAAPLVLSTVVVTTIPATLAYLTGVHLLKMNRALLMGAVAGARQCTASLQAAESATGGAVPAIGYPVPLAIATVGLSIAAYLLAALG
jgi:putative transport protein